MCSSRSGRAVIENVEGVAFEPDRSGPLVDDRREVVEGVIEGAAVRRRAVAKARRARRHDAMAVGAIRE